MSTPTIKLMSGIQVPVDSSTSFMLDSSVLGVLNTNTLGGEVDSEFEASIQSLTISRGRSRQFDRFRSGSAVIVFNNSDRKLDPLNVASPYAGKIKPRLRFQVLANNIPIFSGFATDWDFSYDITNQDIAIVECSDLFILFGNIVFELTAPPGATPRGTLNWVMEQIQFRGETNFDAGNANLGAYQIDGGTQVLDYMFQVAKSDDGKLFIDASGVLQYVDRFGRGETAEVIFADDGSGVPYMSLSNEYGDELLYNDVIATSPAGSYEAFNQESIDTYGQSVLSYDDLLNNSVEGVEDIAKRYLEKFAFPQVRFTGLQVQLAGLTDFQVEDVLNLDLGDLVSVKRSFSVGSPSSVTQELFVSNIQHQIRPDSHIIEFMFEPNPFLKYLRLNDSVRGKINENNVLG